MKRLICLFLCLLLCLPLFACGRTAGTETPTESTPESRTETGTESGTKAPAESGTETGTETEPSPAPDYAHTRTPMMGWASWNLYHTAISEEKILAAANALKEFGLADLGYTYVNIDDGFQRGRDEDGTLIVHPERFPNGMKSVADRIHEMGLYAGIYTDAGVMTCGYLYSGETANGEVGLYGHEEKDLSMYLSDWGYDFIKVDWCGGAHQGLSKKEQYTKIGNIIKEIEKKTGRDILYNICCWEFPGEWAKEVADSWRTGADISPNFSSILYQLDQCKTLAAYQSPGNINDPDMLEIGMGMTDTEDKSHFAMWCMLSAPLMLGNDLTTLRQETLEIITNKNLIALDQDPACIPATVVLTRGDVEIWQKDLGEKHSATTAVALLNRSGEERTVTVRWDEIGYASVTGVTDLWTDEALTPGESFTVTLAPHETAVLRVNGTRNDAGNTRVDLVIDENPWLFDLTALGATDWVMPGYVSGYEGVRKKIPSPVLSVRLSDTYTYLNASESFCDWDGDGNNPALPRGSSGSGKTVRGVGNSVSISVPVTGQSDVLSVLFGLGTSDLLLEVLRDGVVLRKAVIDGIKDTSVPEAPETTLAERQLTVALSSDTAGILTVRLTVMENSAFPVCALFGVALSPLEGEEMPDVTDAETARKLLRDGAVLFDVRSPEEYAEGHPTGAVNLPVDQLLTLVTEQYPDRNTVILTYCSRAKRSLQAYLLLRYLGYENVYWLGSTDPNEG